MLKEICKKGYLKFDEIILDNYDELNLTELEAIYLIKLHKMSEKCNFLSLKSLSSKTALKAQEINKIIDSLFMKGFISFQKTEMNNIVSETFNLEPCFDKIKSLFVDESTLALEKQKIVSLIEEGFKKTLSAKEISTISTLNYDLAEFRNALIVCIKNNVSEVAYLKKVLENAK